MLNELSGKKRLSFINMPIYQKIKSSLHEFQGTILMKSMLFREVPTWELILKTIEQFEKEFNYVTGSSISNFSKYGW
jgi:hypothetical protein